MKTILWITITVISFNLGFYSVEESGKDTPASNITVEPEKLKLPTGHNVNLKCSSNELAVYWISPNGTKISELPPPSRFNDTKGQLTITGAKLQDSGIYTCTTANGKFNATSDLFIYVMPNYFTEGMIILGINAFLLVVFLSCTLNQYLQHRKANIKYRSVIKS